ncbi:MAG TPA: PepSY domain-containing protein [Caulobacteraceae bacterium]|nr:PepSY domain-containing protein [Caulobacteraceae bacterium]
MPALVVGLLLAALAAPVGAQGWHGGRGGGGPGGGFGGPRGFPGPRGPAPQPFRGPPPGPGGWEGDSLGAGWGPQQDMVRQGVRQKRFVPLGQAIESIRRFGPGHELDAGLEDWGGRPAYRVRWAAPNGRRIDYMVDAETGAILSADGGP